MTQSPWARPQPPGAEAASGGADPWAAGATPGAGRPVDPWANEAPSAGSPASPWGSAAPSPGTSPAYGGGQHPTGFPQPSPQSHTQLLPSAPAPSFAERSPVVTETRRPAARLLPAVAVAAVTALIVGGGAGFGVAQLTMRQPAAPVTAPQAIEPATGPNTVEVADRLLASTVTIAYRSSTTGGTGSGFVIDADGHILTNNHVIEGAADGSTQLMVEFADGERVPATIVGRSPSYDLAVIRVQPRQPLKPVAFGDSAQVRPGQGVMAVGAPLGLGGSVTAGIVSAVDRPFGVGDDATADDARRAYINGIQTDAPINPGNSGGPLADSEGRVIGVNSAILTLGGAETGNRGGNIGLGFAIPINQAKVIAEEIIRDGQATYPIIGAELAPNSEGVRLAAVASGGPADQAGIRRGDVVLAVGGRPVDNPTDVIVRIRSHRPGERLELTIRGRGPVTVTLGAKVG